MLLSFDAKQKLKLSVTRNKEFLPKYLLEGQDSILLILKPKSAI